MSSSSQAVKGYFDVNQKVNTHDYELTWLTAYQTLCSHHHLNLSDLAQYHRVYLCYQYIVGILTVDEHPDKSRLIEHIRADHPPSYINPGTVGSYLYGCVYNYYGDVNSECSPLCLTSIFADQQIKVCEDQVWEFSDGKLSKHNSSKSKYGLLYIHADKPNRKLLDDNVYAVLRNNGLIYINIMGTKNGRHYYVERNVNLLDDLTIEHYANYPTVSGHDLDGPDEQYQPRQYIIADIADNRSSHKRKENNMQLQLAAIIIIIVLLVIVLLYVMRRK